MLLLSRVHQAFEIDKFDCKSKVFATTSWIAFRQGLFRAFVAYWALRELDEVIERVVRGTYLKGRKKGDLGNNQPPVGIPASAAVYDC